MLLEINDEDIGYAEVILFGKKGVFDNERIDFIKNLTTMDLQAVPGSGKTTVLLAKLLIFEKYLPFQDGTGILVISHTNTAVDEIKDKISKFCPKLFAYPNFVGTIQSFVDHFLAIPFAQNFLGTRLRWIDTERYQDQLWGKFKRIGWSSEFEKPETFFWGRHIEKCRKEAKQDENKAKELCRRRVEEEVKDLFLDFLDNKIKTFYGKQAILTKPANKKYQGIEQIIKEIIDKETISFEYAYNLANAYIQRAPIIRRLIRKRFKFVFVDEMQDMEKHQYDLLEDLFHCDEVVYQRIGDKNQAIFSGKVNLEKIWVDRGNPLYLESSLRLSPKVAQVVNQFALDNAFQIIGKGNSDISPCLIVFSEDCIDKVLSKFIELVKEKVPEHVISGSKYPIRCIGWRKEGEDGNLGIKSFCADFEPNISSFKSYYPSLISHLVAWNVSSRQKHPLNAARKSVLDALIAILREEEAFQSDGKYFTISSLYKYLREFHKEFYEDFKLKIFVWSKGIYQGRVEEVLEDIKAFLSKFLDIFGKRIEKSSGFINSKAYSEMRECSETSAKGNIYCCPNTGLQVKIGTVHSAKGETHLATLYLETFYQKKHESERLSHCLCGQGNVFLNDHERATTKVAYVAMSRPTHLLCFAIHQSRFEAIKDRVCGWEVINLASN
jgi:superfamily I DNA/RNA helicase